MKIGVTTFSLPLQWWDKTNIAHNKIFSHAAMGLIDAGHSVHIFDKVDFMAKKSMKKAQCTFDSKLKQMDALFVFCGPYMPFDKGSRTHLTLKRIKKFKGRVVFITCDYLLQFDFRTKRYGTLLSEWKNDALVANKDWKYVLHGDFDHHFKTELQAERVLEFVPKDNFIEVPLNMSGLLPTGILPALETPPIDLLYCGAFRKGRDKFFTKYFCCDEAKKWVISTTQQKKFAALKDMKAQIRGPYPSHLWKFLNKSWAQIISSDAKDDNAPMPTRYWEAVAANTVVFFTEQFQGRVNDDLIISSPSELSNKIKKLQTEPEWRTLLLDRQMKEAKGFNAMDSWSINSWIK